MLEVKDLSLGYGINTIVQGLNFKVAAGEILLILGANGSGKSSLLQALAGLSEVEIKQGQIICPEVGLVLQDAAQQILGTTVGEDILLPWPLPRLEQIAKAKQLAEEFKILMAWDLSCEQLSFGQRRKVCLVAALMQDAQVLLLDEPLSGLDYPGQLALIEVLQHCQQKGLTQVVTSHDWEFLQDIVNQVLILNQGQGVFLGSAVAAQAFVAEHPELGIRPWQN